MVRQAAKVIGFLTSLMTLVIWIVLTNDLPFSVGIGTNIIVVIGSILMGLLAYVSVVKG